MGAWVLAAVLVAFESGRFAVVAWLTTRTVRRGWPLVVAFPVVLVTAEWLYPMVFPWRTALLLWQAPVLVQTADLAGPLSVTAWVSVVAASWATALRDRADARRLGLYGLGVPGAVLVAVVAYGSLRMREVDAMVTAAPEARVGLIQGDVGSEDRGDGVRIYREASLNLLAREKPDFLVWPESAVASAVRADLLESFVARQVFRADAGAVAPRFDVPLLAGMNVLQPDPEPPTSLRGERHAPRSRLLNAAVLASADGHVLGEYAKASLVPFGEYLPLEAELPWLRKLLPTAGKFSAGRSATALDLYGRRILARICYEDILAEGVRDAVDEAKPELIVNLTSDAWFAHSSVPATHLALATLRAVEHRRFLVHATDTGVTAVIDPSGRIAGRLPTGRAAAAVVAVRWLRSSTVYETVGNWPWVFAAAAVTMLAAGGRWRSRREDGRA
jgi:apolipoprotein N-acyltransferase